MIIAHKPWWSQTFVASLLALFVPKREEILAETLPALDTPVAPVVVTRLVTHSTKGRKLNKPRHHKQKRQSAVKVGCPSSIEPMYIYKALGMSDGWIPAKWDCDHSIIDHNLQ